MTHSRIMSAREAIEAVSPTDAVAIGMLEPAALTTQLAKQATRLRSLRLTVWPIMGPRHYQGAGFRVSYMRSSGLPDQGAYIPTRTSDAHRLFSEGIIPVDVVLVNVSRPDVDGWCSFGLVADYTYDLATSGRVRVIAESNKRMPYVHGGAKIHISQCESIVESDEALPTLPSPRPQPNDEAVARFIADLIPDGATIQTGIGRMPAAILHHLRAKNDLGVHSGMISDPTMALAIEGSITGASKATFPHKIVTGSIFGTTLLYDWVHDNPDVYLMPQSSLYDGAILGAEPIFVAINSALQIDLTGQVNTELVRGKLYGSVGGQPDFQIAGARSVLGSAILAIPSVTSDGASRIVTAVSPGSPVSGLRSDIDKVVTEHGVAELRGRTVGERVEALVHIAHPTHRARLAGEAAIYCRPTPGID